MVIPQIGQSFPVGTTVYQHGVNFCLFTKNAGAVELLLFDTPSDPKPSCAIQFDPRQNRTFYYWHMFLPGIQPGQIYAYRVHGPFAPERGFRFDGEKVLLDPYARAVVMGPDYDREAAIRPGDNLAHSLRSVVVETQSYDWEGDLPLHRPYSETVIYEMHVAGFTRHPSSGLPENLRGTYAGLTQKIPYLQSLGITAVEMLPVQHFDPTDAPNQANYWGYSPIAFFAPHSLYSSNRDPLGPVNEFRDMVKALHKAGIEVILDVVFNHTAEADHQGPTLSFRGIENRAYYILAGNQESYEDYSGCGNSINGNHSIVRRMIVDCLRYWVSEMHVDGFRFDLASVLARDTAGIPLKDPPLLWEIESDPILSGTKIIAEAWDAVGLYQVGNFIGDRWAEWNGPFRDDVRRFIKSDAGLVSTIATRIAASPDLYRQSDREPNRSINFITCHDGFTLNDLVSYNNKHNEGNGKNNTDGTDSNYSWNCGAEGPSDDPAIELLRQRQIRNLLMALFTSQGTPMLLMGDEIRRTQHGNNNAYCQNNPISWFDWDQVKCEQGLFRFTAELIRFTQSHQIFREERFWVLPNGGEPRITWHGPRLHQPDWGRDSHTIAFTLNHPVSGDRIHILFNAFWDPLDFELPPLGKNEMWRRIVDTSLPSPQDFCKLPDAPAVTTGKYRAQARSSVLLIAAR